MAARHRSRRASPPKWVVEQQLAREGTNRHAYGREQFIERVWRWREESGRTIVRQLMRLGASCDWSRERFTMDEGLSRAVRKVFVTLYQEGLIYRGDYIIQWCPRCMTALSDLEVEYEEREGKLYYIKYGPLTLATVRPETKLGDTALAVHPEDKRYAEYVNRILTIPSVEGEITIQVIADAAVDPEFGTGVVKVTPAHDPLDFDIGRQAWARDSPGDRLRWQDECGGREVRRARPIRMSHPHCGRLAGSRLDQQN